MPRTEYQDQLKALQRDVVDLGELVLDRYELALETMATGDPDLARQVIDGDREVNDRYLALEGNCIDLFALQQPVASDLRFVASSFKILTDLERVGDLATNLADYEGQSGADRFEDVEPRAIGGFAGEMLRDAVSAYEAGNPAACRAVAARDDDLDRQCAEAGAAIVDELLATEAGTGTEGAEETDGVLDDATRLVLVLRDLERVGDHAVNVCARTLYATDNSEELIY